MPQIKKQSNPFDSFTNLYSLSKTLRFELKPVPRTKALLNLEKDPKVIFPEDKVRAENYAIIKKYIDELHAKFINAALALPDAYIADLEVTNEEQEEVSDEQESESAEAEEKGATKSENHKNIINLFNQLSKSKEYKDWVKVDNKNNVSGNLFGKELIDILREEFKDELDKEVDVPILFFNRDEEERKRKLREVLNSFGKDEGGEGKDFTTYFTATFHDNRRNYYKGDGKAGRVATRIVDENLKRFIANKEKFESIRKSVSGDSEEIKKIKDKKKRENLVGKYKALLRSFDDLSIWRDFFENKKAKADLPLDFDYKDWKGYAFGNKYDHFIQKKINGYNFIVGKLKKDINESGVDAERFLKLHKQVHGEVKKLEEEFYIDEKNIFGADDPFIKKFIEHSHAKLIFSQKIFDRLLKEEYSKPEQVFISKRAINTISTRCFAAWHTFGGAILEHINKIERKDRKKLPEFVDLQAIKSVLDAAKNISVDELFKYKYFEKIDSNSKNRQEEHKGLKELQADLKEGEHWQNFLRVMQYEFDTLKEKHNKSAEKLLAENAYKKGDKKQIALLFDFAESANGILNMTKYFALLRKGVIVEDKKYANRDDIHEWAENYLDGSDDGAEERCLINQYYKTLKHFVSQKPWIEDKIVLTFENPILLSGWNQTKEEECRGVILECGGRYYFGYLNNKKAFDYSFNEDELYSNDKKKKADTLGKNWSEKLARFQKAKAKDGDDFYRKIEIYQIANGSKDVSLLLSRATEYNLKKFKNHFRELGGDFNRIEKIKKNESYKTTEKNFRLEDLRYIIDYYKACLPVQDLRRIDQYKDVANFERAVGTKGYSNWRFFDFKLPATDHYKNINEFTNKLEWSGYRIDELKIAKTYIDELIENGELYLFQIYNKDFELDEEIGKEKYGDKFVNKKEWRQQKDRKEGEKEKGRENMETTFFKLLFDQRNLGNANGIVYKLSGGAKIFYRPASKDLKRIKDRYGKEISERQRYGEDKVMFNVPIVMNFVNKNERWRINSDINELIYEAPSDQDKFRIIALDRGEKNLAYLTVLNGGGKILQIESLNRITRFDKNNKPIKEKNQGYDKDGNPVGDAKLEEFKDYHNLLDKRQIDRLKARKSWEPIEKIVNLKEGYLGFVVNKVANLVIDIVQEGKIPIVVLENLNVGMKQGRIQIEKQVYSKVEEKIAKKFNYLVDKKLGNFFNAWQLAPEIKTFGGDIDGKDQVGIIFYVNPSYTSATCPRCGFRKRKYIKADNAKEEFKNIKVSSDGARYTCEFSSEVKNRNGETITVPDKKVYSDVRRIIWDKRANNGRGDSKEIADVTKELDKLFKDFGVDVNSSNLSEQIQQLTLSKDREKEFWALFVKWFNCILEIRNSINKRRGVKDDADDAEIEEWGGENRDFIFCPHCYFDSEDKEEWDKLKKEIYIGDNSQNVEFNGDANGAYNTGRKGIIVIERIKKHQQALIDFKNRWRINAWPKKENDKVPFNKDGKEPTLTLVKLKETAKKDAFYYCILEKGEGLEKDRKSVELISHEKRARKYPDLFIGDSDWDEYLSQNSLR